MHLEILLRERDDAGVARHIDIGFGGIKRDQLGTLVHPEGGGVDARGLAPDFVERSEAVEQGLANRDSDFAPGHVFAIIDWRRGDILIEHFRAGAGVEPDLRQQCTLTLVEFRLRCAAVCGSLTDTGIGLHGLVDGVRNGKRLCRPGCCRARSRNHNNNE